MRADHQPVEGPVRRPMRTKEEFATTCHNLCAVVLALDVATTPIKVQFDDPDLKPFVFEPAEGEEVPRPLQTYEGKPLVVHAVQAALDAQVQGVLVLAHPALFKDLQQALASFGSAVQVETFDQKADWQHTLDSAGFELFELSLGLLQRGSAFAQSFSSKGVLFMRAGQPRIAADQVFELCQTWQEKGKPDCVTSWITWFRQLPMVVSVDFVESIEQRELAQCIAPGIRQAPAVELREHRFGEEKLAPNAIIQPAFQEFCEGVTLSALDALALTRMPEDEDKEAALKALGDADALLVDAALKVTERMEPARRQMGAALLNADAFGARNKFDFPLLNAKEHKNKLVFLDSAATTQRVNRALEAMAEFDCHGNANVYRGSYDLSMKATFAFNDARKQVEDFIGAQRRTVAFTQNASDGIARVASAWGENNIGAGDVILTTIAEHHSCMLPWLMLAQRKGARVEYVPVDSFGRIDMEAYRAAFADPVKLVAISHVGNVMGMINPVAHMAQIAHQHNARFLLDAAQSFAHMPLDVQQLGVDFLVFSGHKAYGPMGIGGLWIGPEAFEECDPISAGGGSISHVSLHDYYLRLGAIQYETGTPPISQAIGLAAALEYLSALEMDEVALHGGILGHYLTLGLLQAPGVNLWGDHIAEDGHTGVVSFGLACADTGHMAEFFGKLGVCVRAGSHCAMPFSGYLGIMGTLRASVGVYNTSTDMDALLTVLEAYTRLLHP